MSRLFMCLLHNTLYHNLKHSHVTHTSYCKITLHVISVAVSYILCFTLHCITRLHWMTVLFHLGLYNLYTLWCSLNDKNHKRVHFSKCIFVIKQCVNMHIQHLPKKCIHTSRKYYSTKFMEASWDLHKLSLTSILKRGAQSGGQ